jgi:hypothetical protein
MTRTISLRDHLDRLLPPSDALIGSAARARLAAVSEHMPPLPRIAVECQLAKDDGQVDLHQCFFRDDYPMLAAHFNEGSVRTFGLGNFFDMLTREGSELNRGIDEIFLEYDLPVLGNLPQAPSVFMGFAEGSTQHDVALMALASLGVKLWSAVGACFSACAARAHVSHIGAMLGRRDGLVRVNVKGLRTRELGPYLRACGWNGDIAGAEMLFDWALERADRVTIALDAGERMLDRIGFECFIDEQPAREAAWEHIGRELCGEGLCCPEKASALLQIPADVTPLDGERAWPAEFIAASLLREPRDLSMYVRRLAHFKLTLLPDGSREAKAYFAALHTWNVAGAGHGHKAWRPTLSRALQPRSVNAGLDTETTRRAGALAHGIDFLLNNQLQSGLWKDFVFAGEISDEWVTAFIGCQLAATRVPRACAAAREAFERLTMRQRPNGGWGYNRVIAPDADSTAWVLRLARELNSVGEVITRGQRFLKLHQVDGGVATYLDEALDFTPRSAGAGWFQPHGCVTAAALPFVPSAATWLQSRQDATGAWSGYWWSHEAYPTALAAEALREQGDTCQIALAAAGSTARAWFRQSEDAREVTAFDLAWCVRLLAILDDPDYAPALDRLLEFQNIDGSWGPAARLRKPAGACIDPAGIECPMSRDQQANFTTAAVIGALNAVAP